MQLFQYLSIYAVMTHAGYTLQQDFMEGGNFLDQFTFQTEADPSNGFVQYVSESEARANNMIASSDSQVSLYADSTEITTSGRKSIRIQSKASYSSGLIILDLEHMPGGTCGTWPAFWTLGPNWPNNGEIDIIEGINDQTTNQMTLHTGANCSISKSTDFTGRIATDDCDINAANQPVNAGCSIQASSGTSYGKGFNDNGGGIYATELTESSISIYFFPRGSFPADITTDAPDPSGWGTPLAVFQGDCDIAGKFIDQQILFNIDFCGDWAGGSWPGSSCEAQNKGKTCADFVGNNPSAFKEEYWGINGLKIFQNGVSQPPTSSVQVPPIVSPTTLRTATRITPKPTTITGSQNTLQPTSITLSQTAPEPTLMTTGSRNAPKGTSITVTETKPRTISTPSSETNPEPTSIPASQTSTELASSDVHLTITQPTSIIVSTTESVSTPIPSGRPSSPSMSRETSSASTPAGANGSITPTTSKPTTSLLPRPASPTHGALRRPTMRRSRHAWSITQTTQPPMVPASPTWYSRDRWTSTSTTSAA